MGKTNNRKTVNRLLVCAIISGIAAIFASTKYLTYFPHGKVIMPWRFPFWAITPFILTGFFLFISVVLRPVIFWPVLVSTAVLTSGMFVLRFPILDEWLVLMITLGAIVSVVMGAIKKKEHVIQRDWRNLFLLFLIYLFFLSIIGLIAYQNVKAIRFSIIFIEIFAIVYLLSKYEFPKIDFDKITLLIAWTTLSYYVLYILHGIIFRAHVYTTILAGIGGIVSTGYQTVISIVGIPASFILICRYRRWRKILGYTVLLLAAIVAVLADSRAGMLAIGVSVVMATVLYGIRSVIRILLPACIIITICGTIGFKNPSYLLSSVKDIVNALNIERGSHTYKYFGRIITAAKGDAGRFLRVRTAVETFFNQNLLISLFGSGIYGYYPATGPYYDIVARKYGIVDSVVNYGSTGEIPRPPALGAMIIETGLIGIFLLSACFIIIFKIILFRKTESGKLMFHRGTNLMLLAPILLTVAWSFFGEIQDIIMIYLLIMPYGIIHTWIQEYYQANKD